MSLSRHSAASDGHSALGNNRRVIVRLCTNILPRSSGIRTLATKLKRLRFTLTLGKEALGIFERLQRPSVPARRDRPLTHRDQAACDRPAGWRPMPLPRCCDVAAPIPCGNLSRSADLGRRGNAGSGHTALGAGNRRKGLAVSSALKNRPGSQVLCPRKYNGFSWLRGVRSGGSFNLPTSGGLRLAVSGGRCGHRPSAPTRPTPRRRRSYGSVRRMTKDSGQSEGP